MHEKFAELVKEKSIKQNDWIKTCLASMSAMLGILIAFSNTDSNYLIVKILFPVTIILFGLCILCGLLFLFRDTDVQDRLIQEYLKSTNNLSQKFIAPISVPERKIFLTLKKLFFYMLFLSIISLCVYGIFLKFKI